MKGKQLSLQEVLNLEDGSKVWVEELKDVDMSALHIVDGNYLNDEEKDEAYCFDDIELYYMDELEFYEWSDDLKIPDQIEEPYYSQSVVESMANEIARHRYPNRYEYDDELIENIIKEFSWQVIWDGV